MGRKERWGEGRGGERGRAGSVPKAPADCSCPKVKLNGGSVGIAFSVRSIKNSEKLLSLTPCPTTAWPQACPALPCPGPEISFCDPGSSFSEGPVESTPAALGTELLTELGTELGTESRAEAVELAELPELAMEGFME
jgi:hypothetical protein